MKLYIGNIARTVTDEQIKELLTPFGKPDSVNIVRDKITGEPRGFGFVEFSNDEQARAAIKALDGKDFSGQSLKVNEARPQKTGGGR
jgi:RNA recognition motif-containing protein